MIHIRELGSIDCSKGGCADIWIHFMSMFAMRYAQYICPIRAINAETIQIDSKKCMYVRCLKCAEQCPAGAIEIKGR